MSLPTSVVPLLADPDISIALVQNGVAWDDMLSIVAALK